MIRFDCPICKSNRNTKIAFIGNKLFPINISICNSCGFVFQNPRFTETEWNNYYVEDYDKFHRPKPGIKSSDSEDQSLLVTYNRILPFIKEGFNPQTVLEIGAGNGEIISYIAKRIPFKNVYAIEPSENCQEVLKKKGIIVIGSSLNNIVEDVDSKADLIVMRHVLEHIYNPVEALKMMTNLLDDNGLFYIAVPNLFGFAEILNCFTFPHISYLNDFTLARTAYFAGLKVVELKASGDELYGLFQKISGEDYMTTELNSSNNFAQTIIHINKNMKRSTYLLKTLKRKFVVMLPNPILKKLLLKKIEQ